MSSLTIILLTAKSDEEDKLKGYEYGADDYMTKPFSPKVRLTKVNVLLRRNLAIRPDMRSSTLEQTLAAGKIVINPAARKVFLDGTEIMLTHKEYDFEANTRTVDTHIKTLRRKLGSEGKCIVTLIRSGYKLEAVD